MREHFSHLHVQPLGLNLVRREICQKADTSSDYAVTFSAWWKSTSLCAELHPWKEDSERQPSAGGWMPCVYSETASTQTCVEMVSGLESRAVCCCVAALKLHFTWTDRSRPGMINSHKFIVILTWFESILVLPLTSKMGFVYYLAFLSLSLLNVKWRSNCQFVRMIVRAQWYAAVGEVASPLPSKLFTVIKWYLLWHSADTSVWRIKCVKEAITGTVISGPRRVRSRWKIWPPHAFPSPTHRTRVLGMHEANLRDEGNSSRSASSSTSV